MKLVGVANRRRVRGILAAGAVGGLMLGLIPTNPAAAVGPHVFATSNCTTTSPYGTIGHYEGFPPNATRRIIGVWYREPHTFYVDVSFTTDSAGSAPPAPDPYTEPNPFRFGALIYRDNDHSFSYTRGDDVIANVIVDI